VIANFRAHIGSSTRIGVCLGYAALLLTLTGCAYAKLERGIVGGQVVRSGELKGVIIERLDEGQIIAKVGTGLKKGDVILTDIDTHVVVAYRSGGTRVVAYPDSKFGIASFVIYWGHVLYQTFVEDVVAKTSADDTVEDGHSIAAGEGTAFDYQVTRLNETTCAVLDGRVHMRAKDRSWGPVILEPFHRLRITRNQPGIVETLSEGEREALIQEFNRLSTLTGSKSAIVPQCVGLNVQTGEAKVREVGFSPTRSDVLTEDITLVGQVLEQNPPAGAVHKKGKRVRLSVGVKAVRIPDVLRLTQGVAEARLAERSLRPRVKKEITGRQPRDTVLRQHPNGGTLVREGTTVDLTVEAPSVEVPPLIGSNQRIAEQNLRTIGLNYREIGKRITGQQREGHVIEQRPAPGKLVPPNSVVSVVVEAPSVVIPNVVGMQAAAAGNMLRGTGVQRVVRQEEFAPRNRADDVIRQNPAAGQRVSPDTPVTVTVAFPGIEVPDLMNNTRESVAGLLGNLGLRPQWNERAYPANREFVAFDRVVDQSPKRGARVPRKSAVQVWIAVRQRQRQPAPPTPAPPIRGPD
jgi:beta-lactam-binding protein with PASTA domain